MIKEEEWYSVCCSAPPLFDLHTDDETDPAGLCMHCRDHCTFKQWEEE